jgi:hypothetical protein
MRQSPTFGAILRFWTSRRFADEVRGGFNLPLYLRYLEIINNKGNEKV